MSTREKRIIAGYQWPGNICELKNVMERTVLLSDGNNIELDLRLNVADPKGDPFGDKPILNETQYKYLGHVLDYPEGNISGSDGASQILNIKRTSLYSKMKALGLKGIKNKHRYIHYR